MLIRDGIQRYNRAQDNPNGYHETITLAWVAVIDRFLRARDCDVRFGVLAAKLLEAMWRQGLLAAVLLKRALVLGRGAARVGYT